MNCAKDGVSKITDKKVYYHLPGLFEFYELYRGLSASIPEHREYFYDWCELGRYMEHRLTVSGAEDVPRLEMQIRRKYWH